LVIQSVVASSPRLHVLVGDGETEARYNLGRDNKSLHASRESVSLKFLYQFIVAAIARPRELHRWAANFAMKFLIATSLLFAAIAGHAFGQSNDPCKRYDDRDRLATRGAAVDYYIEACKTPNADGKPALSIVFTSAPGGDNAMRIYSLEATKPLKLDGIYVERNGAKQLILRAAEIEWANGSHTNMDALDPKKQKKLVAVLAAAFELLKGAAANRRIPSNNSQDRNNLWSVVNFMFDYRLNGK
jgi:hypothetical protein